MQAGSRVVFVQHIAYLLGQHFEDDQLIVVRQLWPVPLSNARQSIGQ